MPNKKFNNFEDFEDIMSSEKDLELNDDQFDIILCKRLGDLKTKSPNQFNKMEEAISNLSSEDLLPVEYNVPVR